MDAHRGGSLSLWCAVSSGHPESSKDETDDFGLLVLRLPTFALADDFGVLEARLV
jgi:hypothetical protein